MMDIPDDVWQAALAAHTESFKDGASAIAEAILVERKRCTDIADKYKGEGINGEGRLVAAYIHREITTTP